jgi:predicted dithiol-disulfide oxidoreductase (DUF899 family)
MKVATEQEWQAARKELLTAEREFEEHARRLEEQRRRLPWVPVEKEYEFATEDGTKSLQELFEGRSQLLIYHLMFGEGWQVACPGCSSLADGLSGTISHMNDRDVTLLCLSQARSRAFSRTSRGVRGRCRGCLLSGATFCLTTDLRSAARR